MTPRRPDPRFKTPRPDVCTDDVIRRYRQGESTKTIAQALGCCSRTVTLRLVGAGVALRGQGKFKRYDDHHPNWKGDAASYEAKHIRVRAQRGRPSKCERCGRTDDGVKYDWANLTGNYGDASDYQRMCRPCHRRYDYARQAAS